MKLYDFDFSTQGHKVEISSDVCEIDLGVLPFDETPAGRINSSIRELIISEGVRRITNNYNIQFINLRSITLPSSIREISTSAFSKNNLARISISNDSNSDTLRNPILCALSLLLDADTTHKSLC